MKEKTFKGFLPLVEMTKSNMKEEYDYYVYIVASSSGTLYIGMTNNLERRIFEHKESNIKGFTKKYSCNKLVYYEQYQ